MSLRADAAANRAAILSAAAEVFRRRGSEASLGEIARAAGVGIGTLYRRFPTRDDLVREVFDEQMTAYAERSERSVEDASTDPWGAFEAFLWHVFTLQATDAAFADGLLHPSTFESQVFRDQHRRAIDAWRALVATVQEAGVVRSDFVAHDILVVLLGNAGVIRVLREREPEAWRRYAQLMIDALRPGAQQ